MMRKLLEALTKFAGEPEQKPGEQWKGTDKGTPGKKLVGDSIIKDLSKGVTPKTKEEELAEAFANFNEDDLGVEEKRPHRKGSRPAREYTKNDKPSKRYKKINEYKVQIDNFTADDIKELEGIRDLATLKARAFQLVSTPSKRPMKPEKVAWFKQAIDSKTNPMAVIKLMWDLLLSGEGQQVIGSRSSMSANSYRNRFNEGWNNGSDRVNLPDGPMTYWNGTGRLQNEYNELYKKLVPSQGAAETIEGEVLRASSKIVYRHFNDGDLFNQASFDQLKQYIGTVTDYDDLAEKAIEFALKAQGNYHPNTGWDSLDVMDYGPEEDDYDDGYDDYAEYPDDDDEELEEGIPSSGEHKIRSATKFVRAARHIGATINDDGEELVAVIEETVIGAYSRAEHVGWIYAPSTDSKEFLEDINWPKEVPSDASQEQDDEDEPHPYGHDLDEAKWRENPDAYSSELDDEGNEYKKSKGDVGRDLLKKDKLGYTRPGNANVVSKGARTGKATQSHINQLKGNIKHSLASHGKANLPEGEHDAEFIDHEDNWYNMANWARAEFKKGKSVEEVIKYLRDNDYLGPRDINNFMKTVQGEKWNESADMFKAGQRAIKNIKSATQQRKSEAEKMAMAQSQIDADRENERDRFSQEELYPSDDSHDVDEGWEADLAKSNRERMKKERAAAKPMKPIAKAKPDYSRVFHDINSAIGDTFPDGDPIDALMRKYRDSYGDLNIDLLNKACRVNGAKSYHDYVAKVWQQHMQDNPDLVQGGNPWVAEGLGKDIKRLATGKDVKSRAGQEIAKSQDASMKGDTKTSKKHFDRFVKLDKLANKEVELDESSKYDNINKEIEHIQDRISSSKNKDDIRELKNKLRSLKSQKVLAQGTRLQRDYKKIQKTKTVYEAEGWESGPEERTTRERDPDAEYDARRQEKLDAEADNAPKTTTYQCVGRGPNDEPNYKFGPEHNTPEEAVAYRKKLMANPKTPNPRDIGIRTISKVSKGINEGIESTDPIEGAVLSAVQELIQQGHTEVAPEVITNMVVSATSQPFLLKDLVDANKNSPAIQHYVDSINPTKVKFSSDILTVKNEDPAKDKAKAQAGVSSMAARAASRSRLGESAEISKQGFPDAFIGLVYHDAEIKHNAQPVPMTKKPTKNDLASNVIVVKGKDGNFYGARANRREGYTIYGQVDGKVGKQYVSSIREVASWIKSGEYFAIPLNSTYYKSREAQRYTRGLERQSNEYYDILKQMNSTFTPGIKKRIEEYIDYIYANLRKLSNEPGRYTFNNGSDQTNALQIAASLEQLVKVGFTRNTVDEYLRSLGKRDVGFGSHYTNIDRFLEQMKEPLAQAKFAKTILDQAKGLYNQVKDMLYAPTVNALTAEGVNEDIAVGRSTPLVDKNDLIAKRKELQKLQMSPWAHKDPKVRTEIIRRKAELMKQAEALGIDESRAHKLLQNKFQQIALQRKLGSPESDAAYKQHVERMKKSGAEYVNNNPNTIYKKVDEFAAPGMAGPAATTAPVTNATKPVVDPAAVAKASAATNTLKAATGTTVGTQTLDKALDSATQGTATSTDVKALAPIMGVVNQAAQDPKLAAQFKTLASQAKLAK